MNIYWYRSSEGGFLNWGTAKALKRLLGVGVVLAAVAFPP